VRTRISGILVALAIALLVPTAAVAADTPVSVYHGTWDSAGWVGCDFPSNVPASGNWNVTILPGGRMAAVHITMFALGMHVDSWGGKALGGLWTVDSATSDSFALDIDLTATPYGSRNTFVLEDSTLTFTIAPWFYCTSATAHGSLR
jgi:hypothetical protein